MERSEGAGLQRVDFDRRARLEFRGRQLSSDGELLDDALGLSDLASVALRDTRRGKNAIHRLDGLYRQPVFGRLALDPVCAKSWMAVPSNQNPHRLSSSRHPNCGIAQD